jgi:hypothetical protein
MVIFASLAVHASSRNIRKCLTMGHFLPTRVHSYFYAYIGHALDMAYLSPCKGDGTPDTGTAKWHAR